MPRGSSDARAGSQLGLNTAGQAYGAVMPELMGDATNPAGINPADLAKMNTAAQQSAGGTAAGAAGEGALLEGRTKRPGSAQAAIAQTARTSGEELSKRALGVQTANTALKQEKRQSALKGLEGVGGAALGQVAPNVEANTKAASQSWDWATKLLGPILQAAGGPATALAGG